MASVEIVRYEARHHDAVLELQRRLWSPSLELNQSYFQWKFVDNPHARFGGIFLALSGSRVIGMRGFMGTLWNDPTGATVPIPLAGDTVVATDFEGHGIVRRLSEAARADFAGRGVSFILNTSSSPLVFWHSCRSGWQVIGYYSHMRLRPKNHWSHKLVREIRRIGFLRGPAVADPFAVRNGADWSLDRKTTVSLRSVADPDAFSALCESAPRSKKYSLLRDPAFFRWRFTNPFYTYYFLSCWHDGGLAAYLVLSVQKHERGPDVRIVDWNCLDRIHCHHLLDTVRRRFPGLPVSMLVNAFTATERHELAEAGFSEIINEGNQIARKLKFRPSLLAIPVANDKADNNSVSALAAGGFDLIEFKGIESDGA